MMWHYNAKMTRRLHDAGVGDLHRYHGLHDLALYEQETAGKEHPRSGKRRVLHPFHPITCTPTHLPAHTTAGLTTSYQPPFRSPAGSTQTFSALESWITRLHAAL